MRPSTKRAIEEYYQNPNTCDFCKEIIHVRGGKVKYAIDRQCCSLSCSSKIDGRGGYRFNKDGSENRDFKTHYLENPDWIYNEYVNKRKSAYDIARYIKCDKGTVYRWMKKHGIPRRQRDGMGPNHPAWAGGPRPCPECGSPKFYLAKLCQKCHLKNQSGENNPNFKGFADIKTAVLNHIATTWRPLIFQRDNQTCQWCGYVGQQCHAHHIRTCSFLVHSKLKDVPVDTVEDRLRAIDSLIQDHDINDLDNGVTLCIPCHKEIHKGPRKDIVPISDLWNDSLSKA